ncbi:MAG: hypothetical protein ACTSU7_00105 [Candidatus Heimdallarchaeaceae archaeon]
MVKHGTKPFHMYRRECRKDRGGCGEWFDAETKWRSKCDKCKEYGNARRYQK